MTFWCWPFWSLHFILFLVDVSPQLTSSTFLPYTKTTTLDHITLVDLSTYPLGITPKLSTYPPTCLYIALIYVFTTHLSIYIVSPSWLLIIPTQPQVTTKNDAKLKPHAGIARNFLSSFWAIFNILENIKPTADVSVALVVRSTNTIFNGSTSTLARPFGEYLGIFKFFV